MQYKKHNKVNYNEIENSLDSKIYEDTLKKLFEYKETLENILTQICLENKNNLLKNTLCKYNFLETNIIKITGYIN